MKHLFATLMLLALAPSAWADNVALDYRASDASCIDASRFADEVSAKLGFVPWSAAATAKIRVRVEKEGAQFTGSVLNVDGSSKIIDGATCAAVTSKLAVTVAGAMDPSAAAQPELLGAIAAVPPPADDGKIEVAFDSKDGRRVDISLNTGGGAGVATNGTRVVTNYYEGLCTTPCTARLPKGRHYLMFQDPDAAALGGDKFLIDGPTKITLHHKSRKGARYGWFFTGLGLTAATVVGGIALGGAGGYTLAGVGGGVGLGVMIAPLFMHDTFTTTRSP